jgi:hypothetical protein
MESMMFTEEVIREISLAAREAGLEPSALLAIADVESAGNVFAVVEGRHEPLIRFEGHYFDRRLSEKNRALARERGLASPVAGAIANPSSQPARWRMLNEAVKIDSRAAYESVSWGLGQVMGAHWQMLGYAGVEALVAEARSGAAGQARLMTLYIAKTGLAAALRERDWETFARGYNGPGYKRNAYDAKITAAYLHYAGSITADGTPAPRTPLLRRGSKGEAVAELQRRLMALGYGTGADGMYGPATAETVKRFQSDHGLAVDGIAGPQTMSALEKALPAGNPLPRLWTRLRTWLKGWFRRR